MSILKLKYADANTIKNLSYQEGSLILSKDQQCIFFDLNNGRRVFSGIVFLQNQNVRQSINPADAVYFVKSTSKFYYYNKSNSTWISINPEGITEQYLSSSLSNYATNSSLNDLQSSLSNYATNNSLNNLQSSLSNYATNNSLNNLQSSLSNYATNNSLNNLQSSLSNYATNNSLNNYIDNQQFNAFSSSINDQLNSAYKNSLGRQYIKDLGSMSNTLTCTLEKGYDIYKSSVSITDGTLTISKSSGILTINSNEIVTIQQWFTVSSNVTTITLSGITNVDSFPQTLQTGKTHVIVRRLTSSSQHINYAYNF